MSCNLQDRFDEWETWLFGNDTNSVKRQIHGMIWDAGVFLSINEARKFGPLDKDAQPELNATVHSYIDRCFFQTQAVAIRRLLDKRNDVVSLSRLIQTLKGNRTLLTRSNLLDVLGYPYDYEKEREAVYQTWAQAGSKAHSDSGPDFINCTHSENVHKNMDSLAGVDSCRRSPADTIRPEILEWLDKRLDPCAEISNYVNKFFAHCATPESREKINADEISVTLGKILDAHKTICQTAGFIGMNIFYRSFGNFLPTPQFDQFEHFEKPWITKDDLQKLYAFWNDYRAETDEWQNWDRATDFGKRG